MKLCSNFICWVHQHCRHVLLCQRSAGAQDERRAEDCGDALHAHSLFKKRFSWNGDLRIRCTSSPRECCPGFI